MVYFLAEKILPLQLSFSLSELNLFLLPFYRELDTTETDINRRPLEYARHLF